LHPSVTIVIINVNFIFLAGLNGRVIILLVLEVTGHALIMTRLNGMFYMIFVISALWAFMPFCWGFTGGGWLAAFIVGGIAFWMGIMVHVNGLKWYWDEVICRNDDVVEWKRICWDGSNTCKQPI